MTGVLQPTIVNCCVPSNIVSVHVENTGAEHWLTAPGEQKVNTVTDVSPRFSLPVMQQQWQQQQQRSPPYPSLSLFLSDSPPIDLNAREGSRSHTGVVSCATVARFPLLSHRSLPFQRHMISRDWQPPQRVRAGTDGIWMVHSCMKKVSGQRSGVMGAAVAS